MQYYQEQVALGSNIQLSIVSNDSEKVILKIYTQLWHRIFSFESRFSRFLPASELSKINRMAGSKTNVSQDMRDILLAAKAIAIKSQGLFNPFILPALQSSGYVKSMVKGHQDDEVDDHSYKSVASPVELEIDYDWIRIPYRTAIDLGGCGKGYLADLLSKDVNGRVDGYWFSLGGDIICGGTDVNHDNWSINIQDGFNDDDSKIIGKVLVPTQNEYAVTTSGTTARHGKQHNKVWHHLINPLTLRPADTDIRLATVCSDKSALEADVLASCAVITGSAKAADYLQSQGINDALLQCKSDKDKEFTIKLGRHINIDESLYTNL